MPAVRRSGRGALRGFRLQEHFHSAQPQRLARPQWRFRHTRLIHKGAVGRAKVFDGNAAMIDQNQAVRGGNRWLVDLKMIVFASSKGCDSVS